MVNFTEIGIKNAFTFQSSSSAELSDLPFLSREILLDLLSDDSDSERLKIIFFQVMILIVFY